MKNSLLVFFLLFSFVQGYSQCTLGVILSSSSPAICSGSSVVLTATASAGTAPYTYAWSTGETTQTINVNKAGTYSVIVSDKSPGCQPVKQSIAIAAATVPSAPTAASVIICRNSAATLTASAPGGVYQWYDAAVGGNFLASGATYITPSISVASTFYVQTTVNGCTSQRTAVNVNLPANPTVTGATICAGSVASLSASGGDTYAWYGLPTGGPVLGTGSTFVTPVLLSNATYYVASTTNGCVSALIPVFVIVTPAPQPPNAINVTICSGSVANLHATTPSGVLDWFTTPTGGISLISSPDFTTPPLLATTTYYAQTTVGTCVSTRTPITVTVNAIPANPVVADATTCSGTSTALTATAPGGTYQWYDAALGGNLLATGVTFNTPVLNNSTIYYVQVSNGTCVSQRTAVHVTITPPPTAPSASGAIICSGTSATLTATAPGGVYQWYDAAVGGNLLVTNASYTTPALAVNTTYYVQTTVAGCTSARTPVTATILAPPAAPTASGTTTCSGSAVTLDASGIAGSYAWYDSAVGGNLLSVGQAYVTPALVTTTTYYVQVTNNNGCASNRTPVTVTINQLPVAPAVNGTSICPGTTATLTAIGPIGTVQWYDAAAGGNLLGTGNSFTTPALVANNTYYVGQTVGACSSSRTPVTVSMIAIVSPQFQYPSGTFCTLAPNPTPAINNPAGGTFSASPAGLVFVSTTTGQINIALSAPGNYVVAFAGNGVCPTTTVAQVSIVTTPNAQFSYSGPFCEGGAVNPFPVFPVGSSGGIFTAAPAGLVFLNSSTGEIDLKQSKAGTYTITNAIAANGPCAGSSSTASVTLDPIVIVSAGPNQTVQSGTPVQLAGIITGGATTGTWSGGTGSFSNPNLLNPIYTPGPGETSATLNLLSTNPPGPCGPRSDLMTITFTAVPPAPTALGTSVCSGGVATLTATAPGGVYKWYDAATAGNLLAAGPNFTTPALIANTTYYVQTTVAGGTSARTPVLVTVNTPPAAPIASAGPVCSGSTATLTASGSAGTYEWYDAAVGGNLLSTNSTYVTTFLNASTSYYVQAVVNGCPSTRTKVDIIINPVPTITSPSSGAICSGNPQNYAITSDIATATFIWSRASVAGISNPAVNNQASGSITETLINTGAAPVNVAYIITPTANGCTGLPFNYVITVNPAPLVTSAATDVVCSGSSVNYTITFNSPGISFNWSRAAVPGISNAAVSGQSAATLREVLFNTTNAPVNVTYVFNYILGGCSGSFNYVITVNPFVSVTSADNGSYCSGIPQNYVITSNIPGATYSWSRAAVPGVSNPSVSGQTTDIINEVFVNNTNSRVRVNYLITPMANGCSGATFLRAILIYPQLATPIANANSPVCVGSTIHLQTPVYSPTATYTWTGPNGFTSASQNPDITNITLANGGTYNLVVTNSGCSSLAATVTVVVDPPPVVSAGPDQPVCHNVASVQLSGSVTGGTTTGVWSTNGTGTFSPASNILNALYIPSAQDRAAGTITLTLASTSKDDCSIVTSTMNIKFVTPTVTSAPTGVICTSTAQNYVITANTPTATYSWDRAAVAGISNPAVANQTSGTINETLVNTTPAAVPVVYTITPSDNGCPGTPFTYTVTVNPSPATPTASANSPVCVGTVIHLTTPTIPNATYAWTGPAGFTSASQNPDVTTVTTASAGAYKVIVFVNGCPSPAGSVNVIVDQPPVANAGQDKLVCPTTASVQLAGSVTGGTNTGMWSTSGTGTFSPSNTTLFAKYLPSAQDQASGSVTLTLASTSNDNCNISTSTMNITFHLLPAVDAGSNQSICSENAAILHGAISIPGGGVWSTSGTGTFSPSASQLDATYYPSPADIKSGSVTLTLTANNAGQCYIPTDAMNVTIMPPPTVNAGGTRYVLKGNKITLDPIVSDNNVQYSWSPDIDISSTTIKNPVVTGTVDRVYTLTVTDERGCVSSDKVSIKVSPEIILPNAFTPNGDGVNDLWNVQGLIAYQNATVDVFDRYGQKVFHSVGYGQPWDGTSNGKVLPFGTYYYIIDTKMNGIVLSGYVTIVK